VVIIEDNHDVAEMLGSYLEQFGHTVVIAHDGHAGLQAVLHHKPDVLICDIGLPGMDGYEIADRLRRHSDLDSCLLIAVTGYGDVADREKAQKAGFVHHLAKPADPAQVAAIIAMQGSHAQRTAPERATARARAE
jgi:CheY-like chemotaxis protein